jgi:hypothetical protein
LFGFIVAALATEAAFYRYRKVPFACAWVPGRFKPHFLFLPASLGLLFGLAVLAEAEKAVLADASRGAAFLAVACAAALALRAGNRRFYRTASLLFDDAPEAALIELRAPSDL